MREDGMWVEKYRPGKASLMVGNEDVRLGFINWIKSWKRGGRPSLLLGPPGVGKTTLVHAVAEEMGLTIVELNASDIRTKERLESTLGPTTENTSLFGARLLILLDEVDGIYGREDYGGIDFITDLLEKGTVPVVMTANLDKHEKMRKLVAKAELFHFRKITPRMVELYLKEVARREELQVDDSVIQGIAARVDGDIRAAINDLQTLYGSVRGPGAEDGRDSSLTLDQGMAGLLKATSPGAALLSLRLTDAQPHEKLKMAFSSLVSSSLEIEKLAHALSAVSEADVILGRIRSTQEWRQLRYFDTILALGIFDALKGEQVEAKESSLPWDVMIRIWNEGRSFRSLGSSLSRIFSVSSRDFASIYLPYLATVVSRDKASLDFFSMIGIEDSAVRVFKKEMSRIEAKLKE